MEGSGILIGAKQEVQNAACVLVPGGFGDRGVKGMMLAAKYARENKVPYLGICLAMQISVIEYARSIYAVSITIRIVLGFMLLALIWRFDFPPFMVLIIAILNDAHVQACVPDVLKVALHCLDNLTDSDGSLRALRTKIANFLANNLNRNWPRDLYEKVARSL